MTASSSSLGLLEIIALLFPVVALLLQLQRRAADSEDIEYLDSFRDSACSCSSRSRLH